MADTLTELERKLKELERELAGDAEVEAAAVPPPPSPIAAVPIRPTGRFTPGVGAGSESGDAARARMQALHDQLDELDRFRTRLEESAAGLMAEYERLLTAIDGGDGDRPTGGVVVTPATGAPALEADTAAGAVLSGRVSIDVGPLSDVAVLSRFEEALAAVESVRSCELRGFEADRATIDVVLDRPTALDAALRDRLGRAPQITSVVGRHVTIALDG